MGSHAESGRLMDPFLDAEEDASDLSEFEIRALVNQEVI